MKETYTKINKSAVKNMISSGWDFNLLVCASKQPPVPCSSTTYLIHSGYFKDIPQFNKWCVKMKTRLCGESTGLTLKFYLEDKSIMNMMDMLKEIMEHENKEEPIIFEIRIHEICRVIRVGKRYSNESKTWAYCYGETHCPTFAYELGNDDEVNKFLYDVLFSIKRNYIKEIKRL